MAALVKSAKKMGFDSNDRKRPVAVLAPFQSEIEPVLARVERLYCGRNCSIFGGL